MWTAANSDCVVAYILPDGRKEVLMPIELKTSWSRDCLEGFGMISAYDPRRTSSSSDPGESCCPVRCLDLAMLCLDLLHDEPVEIACSDTLFVQL